MTHRVMLIGLDAGTFSLLDPLMEEGAMPYLKKMMASGVRAELRSVVPPLTPPGWTSLMTGRSPGYHGITNFFQFGSPHTRYLKLISSRENSCETLWSMVGRQGMRSVCLNFPAMYPPPSTPGYVISGWVPWRWVRTSCYPPNLLDRLKVALPGLDPKQLAVDFGEEGKGVEGCGKEEYEPWILHHIQRERQWFHVLRYLMQEDPCHLTAIVFDGVDRLQHLCWTFLDAAYRPEAPSPWYQRIRALCLEYFRQLDEFIGEIVALAGPNAYVFVVSDHGAGPSTDIFYINEWLRQQGYLTWVDGIQEQVEKEPGMGFGNPNYHIRILDWKRTTAYASTVASNGIFIPVAGERGEEGVPREKYASFRSELVERLQQECVDPETGAALVKRIWTREEAFAGPYMYRGPDLTLQLWDGGHFSIRPSSVTLRRRSEVVGVHRLEGIFVAAGPSIRGGLSLSEVSILDVAPTLLYALGLSIPEDLEGRVVSEMFDSSFVRAHPVRIGASTTASSEPLEQAVVVEDAEGQEQLMKKLGALGYIE